LNLSEKVSAYVSFTPGFSPVMRTDKNQGTVLTVFFAVDALSCEKTVPQVLNWANNLTGPAPRETVETLPRFSSGCVYHRAKAAV